MSSYYDKMDQLRSDIKLNRGDVIDRDRRMNYHDD